MNIQLHQLEFLGDIGICAGIWLFEPIFIIFLNCPACVGDAKLDLRGQKQDEIKLWDSSVKDT